MRLLCVMTGVRSLHFQCWDVVQVTLQWEPFQLGAQHTATGEFEVLRGQVWPLHWYSYGYSSPDPSVFAVLTDTNSVLQTRPRKSSVHHKDHSQLCISWSTSTEGEPLLETLMHCWLVQSDSPREGWCGSFIPLCMAVPKACPVSGTRAQSCALLLQSTQPDIKLISSLHAKFPSEPEILDLFLA